MPDPKTLRVGDRIRILRVPDGDLRQRESGIASGAEMAGWTDDSIERIIAQSPIVRISRIDADGCVWYETTILEADGTEAIHSLIVYDDDTWEVVRDDEGRISSHDDISFQQPPRKCLSTAPHPASAGFAVARGV